MPDTTTTRRPARATEPAADRGKPDGTPAAGPDSPDEVLYRNERTLVVRRRLAGGGTGVLKRALGAPAQARLGHEARVLQRLAGVDGAVQLDHHQPAYGLALVDAPGQTLAQVLLQGRLGLPELLAVAIGLAQTLSSVHRLGVIHKDIKPSNVLLVGPARQPVLIDFNIASVVAEERPGFAHHSDIAGTLAYMPPEQTGRTGRAVDPRSDLYALGVTVYEMATGRRPFDSHDLLEMIHDQLLRAPTPPADVQPDVPPALSDLILRLLEKDADRRYQSADGLARDLVRLRDRLAAGVVDGFTLGVDDYPARLSPPSHLVGRQAEVLTLQAAVDQAAAGPGRALLVAGAPGVGNSALIDELQPLVTARRGWFVRGKFEQYQRDATSAFVQTLRALVRLLLAEPEKALALHCQRIVAGVGAKLGLGPCLLPEFRLLLGEPAPV